MGSDLEEQIKDKLAELYVDLRASIQDIEENADHLRDHVEVDIDDWQVLCGAYMYLYQEYVSIRQMGIH